MINCVIEDGRPFGDFSKPGMLKFLTLAIPGYHPLTRQTVAKMLSIKYKTYRNKLKHYLKKFDYLALTTDIWKNKHLTYFLGLTLHFLDDEFNYVSLTIGLRKFCGRHLGLRLHKFIKMELNKLEISSQIFATTADNGADIVKAYN